jgi:hypothetical protein
MFKKWGGGASFYEIKIIFENNCKNCWIIKNFVLSLHLETIK